MTSPVFAGYIPHLYPICFRYVPITETLEANHHRPQRALLGGRSQVLDRRGEAGAEFCSGSSWNITMFGGKS